MFISSNDEDLHDGRMILNYFFKKPYGYTNPEPILLKELPLKDQIMILNLLSNCYDDDYSYNYKVYEKLAAALTKQKNYKLAKLIIAGAVDSNRLNSSSAENILGSIENLNKQISINLDPIYEPSYEETIQSLQYHLSEKAMITYTIAGLDEQIKEFLNILIDYCKIKIEKIDSRE